MATASCPHCGRTIHLGSRPWEEWRFICSTCGSHLKLISLEPLELDWDRNNLPFRQSRQENWQVEVELDAGREYRFRYLFDGGHWGYDWHSDKSLPDATGCYDSIVIAEFQPAI